MEREGKKRFNSKAKGSGFERLTAKKVSDWWGVTFRKTPASGGLHWAKDQRVSGDIVAPVEASDFLFSIECKKVEGWSFEQVIKNVGEVKDWWEQCIDDATEVSKIPLLVFTKNRSPIYYMTTLNTWDKLEINIKPHFITTITVKRGEVHTIYRVAIGMFDDLLGIPKEEIIKRLN